MAPTLLLTLKALLLASVVSASPITDNIKPAALNLPFDASFIHPVSVIPEIITIPVDEAQTGTNRLTSNLKNAPFVGNAPGVSTNDTLTKRVISQDNRYQYTDRNYPFRTIGILAWTNGVYCTAFTQGPRLVVAAKHCIPTAGVGATFYPSIDNGNKPYGSYPITSVVTNSYPRDSTSCDWEYDWAIFIVNDKVGNTVGGMGIKTPDAAQVGKPYLYNLGHPGDRDNGQRPYKQDGISVLTQFESSSAYSCDSEAYTPLISDEDAAGGQSGSPIWELINNERCVWGVMSVTSSSFTAHGSGRTLVQFIIDAQKMYT